MPYTHMLPKPIKQTISAMLRADGIGVACNFSENAHSCMMFDRTLRMLLGLEPYVDLRGQLQIAGFAASFSAYIEPESIATPLVSSWDRIYLTAHSCSGHLRRTQISVRTSCLISWHLDANRDEIVSARIEFRAKPLHLIIPPQTLH